MVVVDEHLERDARGARFVRGAARSLEHLSAEAASAEPSLDREAVEAGRVPVARHAEGADDGAAEDDDARLGRLVVEARRDIRRRDHEGFSEQARDRGHVLGRRAADFEIGPPRAAYARRTREDERMLRVIQRRAAMLGEGRAGVGHARGDEEHLLVGALAADGERGVEERAPDSVPAVARIDDHRDLDVRGAERVEPEEADERVAVPRDEVLHALAFSRAQRAPFELEPTTVVRDGPGLEIGERVELARSEPTDSHHLDHFARRTRTFASGLTSVEQKRPGVHVQHDERRAAVLVGRVLAMSCRSLVVTVFLLSCTPPPEPHIDATPPLGPTPTPAATTIAKTPEPPPKLASGTHQTLASRSNDDSWDKMLVAGSRLWVLTSVNRWTTGPMYVPAARLGVVPVAGGDLMPVMDLEGFASLAADASSLYVAVNRNLAAGANGTGRIFRMPLDGGAPVDVAKNITPRIIAVDADTLWFDDKKMPKDGSKPAVASGVQSPIAIALDDAHVYFTTGKGTGAAAPAGKNGRLWRMPKTGGAATMLASGLPDEPAGLAVDATHVYLSAVTWTNAETERAGVVARVEKAGGDLEILAKDQPAVRGAWLSADHVYVRSGRPGRPGAVVRIAKAGGAPESFVTDSTLSYATADADSIYFSSDGTFQAEPFKRLSPAILVRVTK